MKNDAATGSATARGWRWDDALCYGGFVAALAFWLAMVHLTQILEAGRSGWWMVTLMSLVVSLPALVFAFVSRARWTLAVWGVGTVAVVALAALPWHPRKAFLDDLQSLTPGTPISVARARMAKYVENDEPHPGPSIEVPVPSGVPEGSGSIVYRWNTQDPRYNADLGQVDYAAGKVTHTTFLPD